MIKAILLLLLCLLASCKCASPEVFLSNEASKLYSEDVIKFIECFKNETADGTGISDGEYKDYIKKRNGQILHVKSFTIQSQVGNPNGLETYHSITYVYLYGSHSPSSTIKSVRINFIDNNAVVPPPIYDSKKCVLYMTLKNNQMASVLASLEQPNTQWDCWYGEFELTGTNGEPVIQKMAEFYRYTLID
jgi:hypothetical protein